MLIQCDVFRLVLISEWNDTFFFGSNFLFYHEMKEEWHYIFIYENPVNFTPQHAFRSIQYYMLRWHMMNQTDITYRVIGNSLTILKSMWNLF